MRSRRGVGALVMVAIVKAYEYLLTRQGASLETEAPVKVLWLAPFVRLLFESAKGLKPRNERSLE